MLIIALLLMAVGSLHTAEPVTITHVQRQMIGIRVAYLGAAAERIAPIVASSLSFSGQCCAAVIEYAQVPKKKREITDLSNDKILFLLVLESHGDLVAYRMYDTTTGAMIDACSGRCVHNNYGASAHHIADKIWRQLIGSASPFNTHIAYAQEVPYKKGMAFKHLCVADFDGSNEIIMVRTPTISIAPRWGGTVEEPLIFYSEYTDTNVRLMVVKNNKKRKVVTRYDGVTMHFTPNHDGSLHAFSASRGDGHSQIYLVANGALLQCTHDDAMNACPVFNHDSSQIYYCSDLHTEVPHLMVYTIATGKSAPLPIKGYAVSPAYNYKRKLLAYSKMIDGILQIFTYNPATHVEQQLTFDTGNHEDPTWSPCGNFLAYTHETGASCRIRVYSYATGSERYITPHGVKCSYPAWSLF